MKDVLDMILMHFSLYESSSRGVRLIIVMPIAIFSRIRNVL